MAISYSIDRGRHLILTRASGNLNVDQVIAHKLALIDEPDFEPNMRELVDSRSIDDLQLSSADIWRIAEVDRRHADRLGDYRLAIVVSAELPYGMARMYQQITEPHISQIRVFSSIDEATAWLGIELPEGGIAATGS